MFEEYISKIRSSQKEALKGVENLETQLSALKEQDETKMLEGVNNIQLAKNFNLQEFICRGGASCCGGAVMIDPELIRRLQKMRDELGSPLNIASGFRCPDYNRRIGGAEKSYHMRGQAADIKSSNISISGLYALAQKHFGDGGIGRYKTFIHVDTGPKRRWDG
jgi:zinc D-Ala-D-Ala carboxypeptidase